MSDGHFSMSAESPIGQASINGSSPRVHLSAVAVAENYRPEQSTSRAGEKCLFYHR